MRLWKPEVFQGSLKKRNYFEGWYFKHVSRELTHAHAFIPGVSLAAPDPHAFIQVIDGITGATEYLAYSLDDFNFDTRALVVRVGPSVFTGQGIELDIRGDTFSVRGKIEYDNPVPYPGSFLSPGIMGWYSFVPFMECYHAVVSAHHGLRGSLEINSKAVDFSGGAGYIEKDWGKSFPESWIWLQCNSFSGKNASLMISIAKIPWLGRFFIGFISFLYLDGRFYFFHTHNGSRLSGTRYDGATLDLTLNNGTHVLRVSAKKNKAGDLAAPSRGSMVRRIKESIDSGIDVRLEDRHGTVLFNAHGTRAGLEVIEAIFKHL
jgi:hypothetical protein